jgi:hypothetical protein
MKEERLGEERFEEERFEDLKRKETSHFFSSERRD